VKYGRQILAGVGSIHAAHTIHFDIKPSNVLFSDSDDAMVADFGQARDVVSAGVTLMPNRMYSTVVPPEAFTCGRRGTLQSDIYQVGLTLWRACNGNQIWGSQVIKYGGDLQQQIINGKFPNRDLYLPHVPDRLRRAIRKALRIDPSERFASTIDFANALSGIDSDYDWRPLQLPENELVWNGTKSGAASLKVTLTKDGNSWAVSLFTEPNRKTRTAMWRKALSRKDALSYLHQLFATLG
jgi:serine/threonine protein kinase